MAQVEARARPRGGEAVKTFDPKRPVTIENWPRGLKMPPLKRSAPKPEKTDPPAPWWSCD